MFVYIQPSVWFGISRTHVQYPSDLLTVNTVTSESECETFFLLFQINSESYYDARMVSTTADGTQDNR